MQPINQNHTTISSLLEIEIHLKDEVDSKDQANTLKVLALDFDHNSAISESYCSSDHFQDFMSSTNKAKGCFKEAHAPLLKKLRQVTTFKSCVVGVSELIKKFKANGWKVMILTARPSALKAITHKNIIEAGLPHFSEADVVFCDVYTKPVAFSKWLKTHPAWDPNKPLRVLFSDDKLKHCENMAELSKVVQTTSTVNVKCFHNTGHLASEKMSALQQKILAVQLAAFKNGKLVPKDHEFAEKDVAAAMSTLSLTELSPETLYDAVKEISAKEWNAVAPNESAAAAQ